MHFDPDTLEFDHFLWFGGLPGIQLPSLDDFKITKHVKANAQGIKTERPNIRYVPKARFDHLAEIEAAVKRLFGTLPLLADTSDPVVDVSGEFEALI